MTRQEFISKNKALRRTLRYAGLGFGTVILALVIGFGTYLHEAEPPDPIPTYLMTVLFAVLMSFVAAMDWMLHRLHKRYGLVCPSCGRTLTEVSAQIAVASGNCGWCGAKLLEDE